MNIFIRALIIFISFCISCAKSEHVYQPEGENVCTDNSGASVTLVSNSTGYSTLTLTAEDLTAGVQGNYPLLINDENSTNIYFFITNQDFLDIRSGYTVTVKAIPPTFVVDLNCN